MILELGLGVFCTLTAIKLYHQNAQREKSTNAGHGQEIKGVDRVAVLLMSLPAEVSAEVMKELKPDLLARVTQAISTLPQITDKMRQFILGLALQQALADSGAGHNRQDPDKVWLSLASQDPALVAGMCSHICGP